MKRHHDIQIQVARKAGVGKGHIILDAGTGPAALLAVGLAGLVGEEGSVIAVDHEKGYIPKIRDAISKSEFPERISFLVGDLRYIPIRDHSLDAAMSLDTIQNMYGNTLAVEEVVKAYIGESMRIVKAGGKVAVGTRHLIPRNRAQEVYFELRIFEKKLEYVLWGEQSRYYFEHELLSWFKKAGAQEVEAEVMEHDIPYPRDARIYANDRIKGRLEQVEPHSMKVKLEEEFQKLLNKLETYGEEWLPTLMLCWTKRPQ